MRSSTGIRWALAWVAALAACGDSGTEPAAVARIDLETTTLQLELGDSARVSVTVRDGAGNVLAGRALAWSSSDARVARVSADGVVTGLAAGTATVTASAEGQSAAVAVTVQPWNIAENAVVVDSTRLRLLSDSAEHAAGRYRFRVLQGAAPTFPAGTIIVGAQGSGFLRRVTSAAIQGSTVTLQTTAAALSDVVEAGGFESRVRLLFAPGSPMPAGPLRAGQVVWGEPEIAWLAPGVKLTATGFDLSGLDICELLAVGASFGGQACPGGIEKLEIKNGLLDFDPTLDFQATFSGFDLKSFRGVIDGTLDLKFTGVLEAETSVTLIEPFKILDLTRPFGFAIGAVPVIGYVDLTLHAGLEVKATAKGSIEAGFTNTHTVQVGATYADGTGWKGVFQSQRTFDAQEPTLGDSTLSGQIDLETKLSFKPEFKIIFYGVVGPFANVEPYGQTTLTFGTQTCGFDSKAGVDSEIGFTIPFLDEDVSDFAAQQQLGNWQGKTWTCPLGNLDVSTITNGQNPDPDGYDILVDSVSKGHIGPTAQQSVPFVQVGSRNVKLTGVAPNCSVQGANPQGITVPLAVVTAVSFTIDCTASTGDIEVDILTTGGNLDPDGYTITLDGASSQAIGINGKTAFSGLAQGPHTLELSGVASNCAVISPNPRSVNLAGAPVRVRFDVHCASGQIIVRLQTNGPPATTNWLVTLDGTVNKPITPTGLATFDVTPGTHSVLLGNLAANCQVQGGNPQSVLVPGSAPVTVTFNVNCTGAGITVTVKTTGDSIPTGPFTVRVDSTDTQPVGINGSVTFVNVAQGVHTVRLEDFPAHCVVMGLNPRDVSAPGGATTFDVLCQKPQTCGTPPSGFFLADSTWTAKENNSSPGTLSSQVLVSQWNHHSVTASATAQPGLSTDIPQARSEAMDYIRTVPVDPTLVAAVKLHVHVTGQVTVTGDTTSGYNAWAYASLYPNGWVVGGNSGSNPMTIAIDTVVATQVYALNDWVPFPMEAIAAAEARNGNTNTAIATLKIEKLVEVRNQADNSLVPILKVCTASGTKY
jgi:hypothetical protein